MSFFVKRVFAIQNARRLYFMIYNNDNTTEVTERIPNKAFDSEYMTEWGREVRFLTSKGIRYTFVKRTPDYNIRQYKYKKTPELFMALAEFYYQTNNEKTFNKLSKMLSQGLEVSDEVKKELISGELNG